MVPPITKSHLQLMPSRKEKPSVLQQSDAGCINHTPERVPCPGVLGQHKVGSTLFYLLLLCVAFLFRGMCACVRTFCLFVFCLIGILFACFDFHFVFVLRKQKEHGVGWVGGIWEDLGEGNMIKHIV